MKILHTEASCGWGGQEIRILEEARGLIQRGHEVSLACPSEARIREEAARYGVPAISLPIGRRNIGGILAMRRHLHQIQPDVVNTHSSTDSWLAALACATLQHAPPIVRTRHISSPIPDNVGSRWIYGRAPAHVVTTGEALRVSLIKQFGLAPERITSIPTGIDPTRYFPGDKADARKELGLNPDKHYVGIIATLRSWKGHRYLIDAFAGLDTPGWQLLVVGSGPQEGHIREQVDALGIQDRVILAGQRTDAERWMRALDVFCLPSYANEGVPQAILQAMMTGLPIITTPVGAIQEAVTDQVSALLVRPEDSTSLAAAMTTLITSETLRARLGTQARTAVLERFTLDAMLDRMEQVFMGVVSPGLEAVSR